MLRLDKVIKPWKEAAALSDHINLYGFWNETAFLTKSGDLGMVLSVAGVDYESLDHAEQEYAVRRLESALKLFGPGFRVYQYLFKTNRPEIPFAHYDDPVVQTAIDQRREFFAAMAERLFQIDIFYCILIEGSRSKTGVGAAFAQIFRDPAGAMNELRTQFTSNSMKTLLRSQIDRDLARLEQHVQSFVRQISDFVQIGILNQEGQFHLFRRMLNYDDWRIAGRPMNTQFLDYQVVNSDIEAERDHLRVGDHFIRVLTMKEAVGETRPLVLDALLKIPANFYAVTEWGPLSAEKARKEVNKRRKHFNVSKTGFVSQLGNDPAQTNPRDVLVDESKQADIENLGDCLRALGDGQSLGEFSLTIVVYGKDRQTLEHLAGEFAGVFTNADGSLFVETYNQLNAYFATVPGGNAFNLRRMYLLNANYADLSFLFTILPGEKVNAHLGAEYLAVLETDNATPYFLNLHNGEVAHTLILGMTGSGKSYLANALLQSAQKYAPLTFIFDIGGSFESLTTIFGGSYLNVGQEARDFTINPFSLPPTKENLQFLFSFFRVLIEGNEQRYTNGNRSKNVLLPVRHLREWIEHNILLELAAAPFSKEDAQLVPEAGPCFDCPKRTGHNVLLFDGIGMEHDSCSDPKCYAAKVDAHVKHTVAAKPKLVQISTTYGKPTDGSAVIPRNKYVEIRQDKPQRKEQANAPEFKTCKYTTEAIVTEGSEKGELRKVCANPECAVHHPKRQRERADATFKAQQEKQRREEALAQATGLRVLKAIGDAVPVRLMKRDLLFAAGRLTILLDERRLAVLIRQHGMGKPKDNETLAKLLAAFLPKADESKLGRILVEAIILLSMHNQADTAKVLRDAAQTYKVDVDAISAQVKQEFAVKEKAKSAAKAAPKPTAKAQPKVPKKSAAA